MTKQAQIHCPSCGAKITVRQSDSTDLSDEQASKIFAAADEMFKAMDAGFKKIFHPSLWKRP